MSNLAARLRGLIEPRWDEERMRAGWRGLEQRRRARTVSRAGMGLLLIALFSWGWFGGRDPSLVRFSDGSTAQLLDDQSLVRAEPAAPGLMVARLDAGRARFEIVRDPSRRFRVETGEVTVEVLGTRFSVEKLGAQARVEVERGHVRVSFAGGTADLIAGQGGLFPPATKDPVAELLRAADLARAAGHPADALAPLTRVADEHAADPRAPLAAFTLGRLYLDELHRPAEAAAAFARARALAPGGPLAGDARQREAQARGQK